MPDPEKRLVDAAHELFVERGYAAVTVKDIAERAGLTSRSFFRYFSDKREVLFHGADQLPEFVERRLRGLTPGAVGLDEFSTVLTEIGERLTRDRDRQRARQSVIAGTSELEERERTKNAALSKAISRALESRGMPPDNAALTGAVVSALFASAYNRTLADDRPFTLALAASIQTLQAFVTAGASRGSSGRHDERTVTRSEEWQSRMRW